MPIGVYLHKNGSASGSWKGGRIVLNRAGYIGVYAPDHPRASAGNGTYVSEHILVAERALGKYLPRKAEVHHVNEIKSDNRNSNLMICEDLKYHRFIHQRSRAYHATGNVNSLFCVLCGKWELPGVLTKSFQKHKECHARAERKRCGYREFAVEG